MLILTTSAVLLVDAPPSQSLSLSAQVVSSSRRMLDAASLATVPMIVGLYPTATPPGVIATSVNLDGDALTFPFDPSPADWPSSPLGAALAATGRNQVVVLGVWLEEAVTWLALNCLSVGLDTYVPTDATPAIDTDNEPAARARLIQAGAVPTSTAQIIREWAALHMNARTASAILGTLPSGRSR
jgi:hypothetical protein